MELVLNAPGDCIQTKYRNAWMAGIPRQFRKQTDEPRVPRTVSAAAAAKTNKALGIARRAALAPEVLRLNRAGHSGRSIARTMRISDATVKMILEENSDRAILTDGLELVRARNDARYDAITPAVRAARAAGTSKQHLMRDFRIGLHALNKILSGP